MTSSQRATLTKQLLKTRNGTRTKYGGLTIRIPLEENYLISYHSGGSGRRHKGFRFGLGDEDLGRITYCYNGEWYELLNSTRFWYRTTREAFHDVMREHPPLMEWILFNGF